MQRYGQFNHTQAGTKVSAMYAYHVNNELAEFLTHFMQLLFTQLPQVRRGFDLAQQGARRYIHTNWMQDFNEQKYRLMRTCPESIHLHIITFAHLLTHS
jgi:hypothetical protein